jgi:dienelactone hydrolase
LQDGEMRYGLQDAWVLAPEREGAHNWEGHGEATALASVAALQSLANTAAWKTGISAGGVQTDRFVVTGHSRGGHGAWLIAAHLPDRVTGVVGAAGWLKREEYGDANIAFRHDTSLSHMDPGMEAALKGTNLENDVELYAPHLTGMRVLGRVGSVDTSVPPYLTKRMIRLVNEHGGKAILREVRGKGHWWWDSARENDGGTMFDPEMRRFIETSLKRLTVPHVWLPGFEVISANPAVTHARGGIRILQQVRAAARSVVRVSRTDCAGTKCRWKLDTWNVCRFRADALGGPSPGEDTSKGGALHESREITVDGERMSLKGMPASVLLQPEVSFCRACELGRRDWRVCKDGQEYQRRQRGPGNYGPLRHTFRGLVIVVIGTQGGDHTGRGMPEACQEVALRIANSHFYSAGTPLRLLNDTALTPELAAAHNLVLIGGPEHNSWSKRLTAEMGLFQPNGFQVGPCRYGGRGIGVVSAVPHWDEARSLPRRAMVLAGTDPAGLRATVRSSFSMSQELTRPMLTNMHPDYLVYGPDLEWKGMGGFLAAGNYGSKWEWRADSGHTTC